MEVLILSKTRMKGKCCVGGITEKGRLVRLLTIKGENQPENTEFAIRQIWNLEFYKKKDTRAPHCEDVLVQSKNLIGNLDSTLKVVDFIKQRNIVIWQGCPDNLFEGLLQWTNSGSAYINKIAIPTQSAGFWISDRNLTKNEFNGIRYNYPAADGWRSIKYIGFEPPIAIIPAGTLIRVSLARWWQSPGENTEERCYLQLSGWYDLE